VTWHFDNMSHEWTIKFIEHKVADRRIIRLIQKWLKAYPVPKLVRHAGVAVLPSVIS
jgi:hypothetical protein